MAKVGLHRLDVVTVFQRDRCKRVAQGMEGIVAHAAVQQDALEVFVHRAPIKRLPKIVREHQMKTVVPKCACCQLLLILLCPLMPQDPHGVLREDHLALLALFGWRKEVAEIALNLLLLQLLTDIDAVVIKINILPAQAEDLGQAQAGENVDEENVVELLTVDCLQEPAQLGGCDRAHLMLRHTRQRAALGYIAEQQFVADGGFQHVVQDAVDVADGFGGQLLFDRQGCDELLYLSMGQIGQLDLAERGKNMVFQNLLIGHLRAVRQIDCADREVFLRVGRNGDLARFLIGAAVNVCGCVTQLGGNLFLRFAVNGMTEQLARNGIAAGYILSLPAAVFPLVYRAAAGFAFFTFACHSCLMLLSCTYNLGAFIIPSDGTGLSRSP